MQIHIDRGNSGNSKVKSRSWIITLLHEREDETTDAGIDMNRDTKSETKLKIYLLKRLVSILMSETNKIKIEFNVQENLFIF